MDNQDKNLDTPLSELNKFTEFAKMLLSAPKPEIQAKAIRAIKHKPTKP